MTSTVKILTIALSAFVTFSATGCFVGMPSRGNPDLRAHVGETHSLAEDALLVTYFGDLLMWPTDQASGIGPKQMIKGHVAKGEQFVVKRIRKYRMPAGIQYSYRCYLPARGIEFDLEVHSARTLVPGLYENEE